MDIVKLQTLLTVSKHRSITEAAGELYITPVSLWEQINRAEKELGFRIFLRSRKGIELTASGKCFCEGLSALIPEYKALTAKCLQIVEEESRTISVAMYPPYSFQEFCETYAKEHPSVRFLYGKSNYDADQDHAAYMEANHYDLMQECYALDFEQQGLCFLPLWTERHICLMRPGLLEDRPEIELSKLKGKMLYATLSASIDGVLLDRAVRKAGIALRRVPFDDFNVMSLCSRGNIFIGEEGLRDIFPQLQSMVLPEAPLFVHGLVYRPSASKPVMDFIEFLQGQIGEEKIREMEANCLRLKEELLSGERKHPGE